MDYKLRHLQAMKDEWGKTWRTRILNSQEVDIFYNECNKRKLNVSEVLMYLNGGMNTDKKSIKMK